MALINKPEIIVVGIGPGPIKYLTQEAREILQKAERIYFRLSRNPVYEWLENEGKKCIKFDTFYNIPNISYKKIYETINKALLKAAQIYGSIVYAVPGHPWVLETTTQLLKHDADSTKVKVSIVEGLSFIEPTCLALGLNLSMGIQIVSGLILLTLKEQCFTEKLGLLLTHIGITTSPPSTLHGDDANSITKGITDILLRRFPSDHEVTLIWSTGMPGFEYRKTSFPLSRFPDQTGYKKGLANLYIPPI